MIYKKERNVLIKDGRFGKFKLESTNVSAELMMSMETAVFEALRNYREDLKFAMNRIKQARAILTLMMDVDYQSSDLFSKHRKRLSTLSHLIKMGADITACDGNFAIISDRVMISLSNRTWKRLEKEEWFYTAKDVNGLKALVEELVNYENAQ